MRVQVEPLRRLVETIFSKVGCPADECERIAHYLSLANLTGHDSHGVIRVPRYVTWIKEGRMKPGRKVETVLDTPVISILDAGHGMGQSVGPEACAIGIEKAKAQGVSVIALRNAGHLGRIGDFAEMAIEAGLVSIHFVNVYNSLLVAPFGGAERRFSTNPIAIGMPVGEDAPFVLDFATAYVAEGKVLVARQGGKPVPDDALVDGEGNKTGDPAALYGDAEQEGYPDPRNGPGAIRTFGEHKGSGLALACELLAGALVGSGVNAGPSGFVHNGMLSIYLDPKVFETGQGIAGEAKRFVDWIRAGKPVDEEAGVMIPGDIERKRRAERSRDGIELSDDTWNAILGTAREVGLDQAEIDRLLAA